MSLKYFHLDNLPSLDYSFIKQGLETDYEIIEFPNAVRADATLFEQTDFFKMTRENLGNCSGFYLKNYPMQVLDWHEDYRRACSVNWEIKSNYGAQLFYRNTHKHEYFTKNRIDGGRKILFYELERVFYEPFRPVLLNTKHTHMVINNSTEERIILSLSLFEATYHDAVNFFSKLTMDKY